MAFFELISFPLIVSAALSLIVYAALKALETRKIHAQEPPVITSAIPFLGHLIFMLGSGSRYFKHLGYSLTYLLLLFTAHVE